MTLYIDHAKDNAMKKKYDLNQLPHEIHHETSQYLKNTDLLNLILSNKKHANFFKPLLDVRKFLHHLVRGERDIVMAMLDKDIHLIHKRGEVKDCSERFFFNISGMEYLLWALDKHMWTQILDKLPNNNEGASIKKKLTNQYYNIKTQGISYRLGNNVITESHFDFDKTLIKALQNQVDFYKNSSPINWELADKQWINQVGNAQRLLPIHVVYEYCSSSFDPVPTFNNPPTPYKQFYNSLERRFEDWFHAHSRLGQSFAIHKSGMKAELSWFAPGSPIEDNISEDTVTNDLNAIKALFKVRFKDFNNFISQLANHKPNRLALPAL